MSEELSLIAEFQIEAQEHLQALEHELTTMMDKENISGDSVRNIFRYVHTLKGNAGFLNLGQIVELSHLMETLLTKVRDKEIELKREIIRELLVSTDVLAILVENCQTDFKLDLKPYLKDLNRHLGSSGIKIEESEITPQRQSHPSLVLHGFQTSTHTLELIQTKCPNLYCFELHIENWKQDSPKVFDHLLKKTILIETRLIEEQEKFHYRVLLACQHCADLFEISSLCQIQNLEEIQLNEIVNVFPEINTQLIQETESPKEVEELQTSNNLAKQETVRIRLDLLDRLMMLAGELVLVRNEHLLNVDRKDQASRQIAQKLNLVTTEIQESIMRTRMQPIGNVFNRFSRIVRDLGQKLGKQVRLEMMGNDVEIDKTIADSLSDPLIHIIRNSCDHGIEDPTHRIALGKNPEGTIRLNAFQESGQMIIEIADDGKGMDENAIRSKAIQRGLYTESELSHMSHQEILRLIFVPGFSTANQISDVSGRGVGMDVVKTTIEGLGGMIDLESQKDRGSTLTLHLPLTLAIIPSLIVKCKDHKYAIPQVNCEELVCLYDQNAMNKIEIAGNRELYRLRDSLLPMLRLEDLLDNPQGLDEETKDRIAERSRHQNKSHLNEWRNALANNNKYPISLTFAVLTVGQLKFGLVIDQIIGAEEIVVKPMHHALADLNIYAGATVLGDGSVSLILDVLSLARHGQIDRVEKDITIQNTGEKELGNHNDLLLFKYGKREQLAIDIHQISRIEKIQKEQIEIVGHQKFISIRHETFHILELDQCIDISPMDEDLEELYLLLPKHNSPPHGFIASQLIDIGQFDICDSEEAQEPGVLSSALLRDHLTLILDLTEIAHQIKPEWSAVEEVCS